MKSVRYFTLNYTGFTTAACEKQGYLRLIAGEHVFYTDKRYFKDPALFDRLTINQPLHLGVRRLDNGCYWIHWLSDGETLLEPSQRVTRWARPLLIISLLTWMSMSRLVRAETLSVKEREYVLYARASGEHPLRIIVRHIIPGVLPTIIVAATLNIASAILMESTLSFLGLGVQAPAASWGSMLNNAQSYIGEASWLAMFPGILILLTVFSFNVLGDVFRTAFEPGANRDE